MTDIPFMFPVGGATTAVHSWDWTTVRPAGLAAATTNQSVHDLA